MPRRLAPKRANKIRKLFNLKKVQVGESKVWEDDVRKYVVRRTLAGKAEAKNKKFPVTKAPKIQRLVTPVVLQRRCGCLHFRAILAKISGESQPEPPHALLHQMSLATAVRLAVHC